MGTIKRIYLLPDPMLDVIEHQPLSRSDYLRKAIKHLSDEPTRLLKAIESRMASEPSDTIPRTRSVTVSFDEDTIQRLAALNSRTGLGTENVLRLAVEAYMVR